MYFKKVLNVTIRQLRQMCEKISKTRTCPIQCTPDYLKFDYPNAKLLIAPYLKLTITSTFLKSNTVISCKLLLINCSGRYT